MTIRRSDHILGGVKGSLRVDFRPADPIEPKLVRLTGISLKLAGGRDVGFLIGGPDGLDPALRSRADMLLRLSSLTLPHALVRVLLAEQLYRALSLLDNHPDHRQ